MNLILSLIVALICEVFAYLRMLFFSYLLSMGSE